MLAAAVVPGCAANGQNAASGKNALDTAFNAADVLIAAGQVATVGAVTLTWVTV